MAADIKKFLVALGPDAEGNTSRAMTAVSETTPNQAEPIAVDGAVAQTQGGVYKIGQGETLYSIAQSNPFTLKDLMLANPDIDPTNISVGQDLVLPSGFTTPEESTPAAQLVEDIQLEQDVTVDTIIEPPTKVEQSSGERFSESTRAGSVSGVSNTFSVNGSERSIIDVGETTVKEGPYTGRARENIDIENVVMHYTGSLYKYGVRHYMNSFVSHNNVTAAFFIDRNGQIYQTFDPTVKGAHVSGSAERNPFKVITNSNSVGIEVEATDDNPPTAEQKEAAAWLADYLVAGYGAQRVVAHPQANTHKGHVEGFDLVNYWRKKQGMSELVVSGDKMKDLLRLSPTQVPVPPTRPTQ